MSIEMWSIAVLSLIMVALTFTQGALVPTTQGFKWGLGSRDEPMEKSALQSRFDRTVQNQSEAMLMYVPLMALVIALDKTNSLTAIAAWCTIVGRVAFCALYLSGTFLLRSAAYAVGVVGVGIAAWQLIV